MVLDPHEFEAALRRWCESRRGDDHPPDGKCLRGTQSLDQRALMVVSAFDHQTATVLRQRPVPRDTNEQKAVLDLLKELVLTCRVVTLDALHCQQETCRHIVDAGGHYVIAAKDNQPALTAAIASEFAARDAAFSPRRCAGTSC